jgi:protein-disulfide isomerase
MEIFKMIIQKVLLASLAAFVVLPLAAAAQDMQNAPVKFLDYNVVMGNKNAPVEMREFIAFSCPHCKAFHEDVFPKIKKKYIDTGKLKLITHTGVQNRLGLQAAKLSRCVPAGQYYKFLGLLLAGQDEWINREQLEKLAKQYGERLGGQMYMGYLPNYLKKFAKKVDVSGRQVKACIKSDIVQKYVMSQNKIDHDTYHVELTPTILIAGKAVENPTFEEISKAIEAALVKSRVQNIKR